MLFGPGAPDTGAVTKANQTTEVLIASCLQEHSLHLSQVMQFLMKLLAFCNCCTWKSSERRRPELLQPLWLFRQLLLIQRLTRAGGKQEGEHFRILASHPPSTNGNNVRPGKCLEIQLHTFKESISENRLCFRDLPSFLFL